VEISEWKAVLEREREEKNRFFATHRQSPIPPELAGISTLNLKGTILLKVDGFSTSIEHIIPGVFIARTIPARLYPRKTGLRIWERNLTSYKRKVEVWYEQH
jgi:hypothetical protein